MKPEHRAWLEAKGAHQTSTGTWVVGWEAELRYREVAPEFEDVAWDIECEDQRTCGSSPEDAVERMRHRLRNVANRLLVTEEVLRNAVESPKSE